MNDFDVTMLEGDGGQRGFRIVKGQPPAPDRGVVPEEDLLVGLELLVARSRQPRLVKSTDPGATVASVVAKASARVQGSGLSAFTQVFKGLRAQGSA